MTHRRSLSIVAWSCVALLAGPLRGAAVQTFGAFEEVPLQSIRAGGWMRELLATQARGLTGHIEAAGHPFDRPTWEAPDQAKVPDDWARYEQTAYWVDGALRCAYLADDATLLARVRPIVDHVLKHPDPDGYLGPRRYKRRDDGSASSFFQWPNAVFFRAIMAEQAATGDATILDALTRHYLDGKITWDLTARGNCNAEAILWLYGRTGDRRLLDLANDFYEQYNRSGGRTWMQEAGLLAANMPRAHGVSYAELAKLGAINFLYTGDARPLRASVNGFEKVARDHVLASGAYSSQEGMEEKDSLAAHETCVIADYTWSLGYLLMATGEARWADRIERAVFNAGLGAVSDDFKANQYFSSPNQVISTGTSSHTPMRRGNPRMAYRPSHETECCTGNVHRIFPNYAARAWMTDRAGGLVAALYAPGRVTGRDGLGFDEQTAYPFDDTVTFVARAATPVDSTLTLRIPEWCGSASVTVNGAALAQELKPGTFATIRRRFSEGDRIVLTLPADVRLRHWPEGGVSVERGPLVYSLKVDAAVTGSNDALAKDPAFPALSMTPTSPWNYALDVDDDTVAADAKVERRTPAAAAPIWTAAGVPLAIRLPARRVDGWAIEHFDEVVRAGKSKEAIRGDFNFTPPLPDVATLPARLGAERQTVTLIPLGAAKLRVTLFPWARPFREVSLNETFDGRSPIGWDSKSALLLNFEDGAATVTANGRGGAMRSAELLMDFSKPVLYSVKVDRAEGRWSLFATDETGKETPVAPEVEGAGERTVDIAATLGWTGPRRFHVGFKFFAAGPRGATLSSIQVQHP